MQRQAQLPRHLLEERCCLCWLRCAFECELYWSVFSLYRGSCYTEDSLGFAVPHEPQKVAMRRHLNKQQQQRTAEAVVAGPFGAAVHITAYVCISQQAGAVVLLTVYNLETYPRVCVLHPTPACCVWHGGLLCPATGCEEEFLLLLAHCHRLTSLLVR